MDDIILDMDDIILDFEMTEIEQTKQNQITCKNCLYYVRGYCGATGSYLENKITCEHYEVTIF